MKRLCILIAVFLLLAASPSKAQASLLWPVEGYYNISSGFGKRTSGTHKGIDINSYGGAGSIAGAAVQAAKGGTVSAVNTGCVHNYAKKTSCGCGGGYGNFVYVQHDDGSVARYAHMDAVYVTWGQRLGRGDILGTVGSTGSSSGFHLHFELRDGSGNPVNVMPVNTLGRHTYYGSSAPHSEVISYIYTETSLTASLSGGNISVQLPSLEPGSRILVAQYSGERLVSLAAGDPDAAAAKIPLTDGADNAKVMLWEGILPVTKAVFLQW